MTKNQRVIERFFRVGIVVFMVALVLAMYPHTPDPTGHIKKLITTWFAFFIGVGWLLAAWRYKLPFQRPRIFFDLWLCFLAFYVIATARSSFFVQSFLELSWFACLFVIYLVATQVYRNLAQVRRTLFWLCAAVALSSVYGFMQMAGLDPFPWGDKHSEVYTNLPATYGNPNYAAHTLILAIVLTVYLVWSWRYALPEETAAAHSATTGAGRDAGVGEEVEKGAALERGDVVKLGASTDTGSDSEDHAAVERGGCLGRLNWPILFLALLMIHLYQTSQRAGMLALAGAFALVLVAWIVVRRFKRPAQGIVISLTILGALGFLAVAGTMTRSYVQTGSPFPLDTSILLRYQSYVSATRMVLDKPVLGHGPGVYAIAYPEYWTRFEQEYFAQELRMNAHVHNDLLELAVDAGLPAAGLFLAILVLGICYGLLLAFTAKRRQYRYFGFAFAAFLMAFLIDGLFGFNLRVPVSAAIFFLLLGMLEGLHSHVFSPKATTTKPWLPPAWRRPVGVAWRCALVGVLGAFLVYDTRVFASEYVLQQGLGAQLAGDNNRARRHYEEAEALAPWNHYMPRRLALLAIREGELEEAVAHLDRALDRNPFYFLNHLPMAHSKLRLAQQRMVTQPEAFEGTLALLESAAGHVERMRSFSPMLSNVEELLGRIALNSALCVEASALPDRIPRARAYRQLADDYYSRALELGAPNPSRLYLELARLRMTLNDVDGAEEALVRAAQANPHNIEVWPQYLDFAHAHDRFDRMRSTLEGLIARLRGEAEAGEAALIATHLWLASTLENGYEGQEPVILEQYRQALRLQPDRYEVWVNFARFARQNNYMPQFEDTLTEFVALMEEDGLTVPGALAAAHVVLQRGGSALDQATMALLAQVRSHPPDSSMTLQEAYGWAASWMLNKVRNADALARGAAARQTEAIEAPFASICGAYMNLGIVNAEFGELLLADQLFSQAVGCIDDGREASLALHWADVLTSLERDSEALSLLTEMRRKDPENLDIRWALARFYGRQGRIDDARVEYDFLLEQPELSDDARQRLEAERAAL